MSYKPKNGKKRIQVVETKDNYSGERSPYWDFVKTHARGEVGDSQIESLEDSVANPDLLDETDTVYNRPLTETGKVQLDAVREALPLLSDQQRKVVYLCGIKGLSYEKAAQRLGITKGAIQELLTRARKKIVKKYEERCHTKDGF